MGWKYPAKSLSRLCFLNSPSAEDVLVVNVADNLDSDIDDDIEENHRGQVVSVCARSRI